MPELKRRNRKPPSERGLAEIPFFRDLRGPILFKGSAGSRPLSRRPEALEGLLKEGRIQTAALSRGRSPSRRAGDPFGILVPAPLRASAAPRRGGPS